MPPQDILGEAFSFLHLLSQIKQPWEPLGSQGCFSYFRFENSGLEPIIGLAAIHHAARFF